MANNSSRSSINVKFTSFIQRITLGSIRNHLMDPQKRFFAGVFLVGFFVLLLYAINTFQINIDWSQNYWAPKTIVPALKPVGVDFKLGWYDPALSFSRDGSIGNTVYPPLVTALALGYTFLKLESAYKIQISLLFIANILTIFLTARMLHGIVISKNMVAQENQSMILAGVYIIAGLIIFMNIGSYGFLFSIERGNYDIYAILMSVVAILLLIRNPKTIWAQVICLSIATHLKIYPIILFIPLLWRHKWRLILPTLVVNLALLLVLGPRNAILFLQNIQHFTDNPYYWVGNHSAYSFVAQVQHYMGDPFNRVIPEMMIFAWILTGIPLILWLITVVRLLVNGFTPLNVLLIFVISVPVMSTFPHVSHDYKLVIFCVPLLIMIVLLLLDYQKSGKLINIVFIALILIDFMFIFQSYVVMPLLLVNKYPFILFFEFLVFISAPYLSRNLNVTPVCCWHSVQRQISR